jgi:hypothetical protein
VQTTNKYNLKTRYDILNNMSNLYLVTALLTATGWTIGILGFDSRRGLGIFLFTTAFRTALGPTYPIHWVPDAFSLGVKRPGREADHSPPSSAEVKECVELYLHFPNTPSWLGAQLKHKDNFTFTFVTSVIGRCPITPGTYVKRI